MTTVFISYSHDSAEHAERVLQFANQLRTHGIDAELDQYQTQPAQGWPRWCEEQLRPENSDFVLVICTRTYLERVEGKAPANEGRGVYWEGSILYNYLYGAKGDERFLLVLVDDDAEDFIPIPLRGYNRYRIRQFDLADQGYEDLYRTLTNQPKAAKPPVGEPIDLEQRGPAPVTASGEGIQVAASLPQMEVRARFATSRLVDLGVTDRFDELVGREAERKLLTEAWEDEATRILVFVAEGGVGKTSLVADWLTDFMKAGWEGVDAFFDWSFYSQGTREHTAANSGLFFDAALRHFGQTELADSAAPADQKADRLAECVARGRTLLVLDGVEPLQHPKRPGGLEGRFRDTGIERLLKRIAQMPAEGGLCVVTTRVAVVDLNRFHGATVREHLLDHLSDNAAAQLLYQAGARRAGEKDNIAPDDPELLDAARELKGHALAAQLLAGYLKQAHGGDIRQRDKVDWKRAFDEQQEGHAWQVMSAYERWFEQQGDTGRRQVAALRLLGFFDRPVRADCLEALRSGEVVAGLNEPLADMPDEDWDAILTQLAGEHRLVSLLRRGGGIRQVDSHPLMREYFGSLLRKEHRKVWIEGHRRLFDHLCETTEHQPDMLEGLQPLYEAVAHGCLAGLHERALYKVYVDRILRGTGHDGFYSWKKLGAIDANLGAVACFFERPWSQLSPNLSPSDQAWLLNEAANYMRFLGRLTESVEPMRAGLQMRIEEKDWGNAAWSANNLSELELTLGHVSAAVTSGAQSVDFADRSGDAFHRMSKRTAHADALHHAGRRDEARQLFAEAEDLQAERQPYYPRLYALQGFRYCDLLLSEAERQAWRCILKLTTNNEQLKTVLASCEDVTERAMEALDIATNGNLSLLTIALDHLTLGRAALYRALFSQSEIRKLRSQIQTHLDASVDGFRQSGNMAYLPNGLLSRAWFRFLQEDKTGSEADLAEAQDIAERGPMPLFLADVHLIRARLFHDREALKQAEELLKHLQTQGYHRRDEELADALEAATTWAGGN